MNASDTYAFRSIETGVAFAIQQPGTGPATVKRVWSQKYGAGRDGTRIFFSLQYNPLIEPLQGQISCPSRRPRFQIASMFGRNIERGELIYS
jgi:hypothetical protein